MKIHLIYPDVSSIHGIPYHPGLASISAVLGLHGHDVRISYFDRLNKMHRILTDISQEKPDVVGFTAVETQLSYAKDLASHIKKVHRCITVCGGVHATLFPEIVTGIDSPFDVAVMGEGEFALLDLVTKVEKGASWRDVPNIAFRDPESGTLVRNPLRPIVEDLDSLPFPATELFPYQEIIDRNNMAMFHFNRGCPYHCAFCSNEALGKAYGMNSNRMRYRSVESVIQEITATLARYRLRYDTFLCFQDDLFISNKEWIRDFCSVYAAAIRRPFWCTGRSNHITDEICAALKKAGCAMLMMSVESGNDYIRNEVMRRNISKEVLTGSFEKCHRHGINTMASSIIGLPFETPAMIEDSIKTIAGLKSISSYGINTFYPYKGTALRDVCEKEGFMPAGMSDGDFVERKDSILNLPTISKKEIKYYNDNWQRLIMNHKTRKERFKFRLWCFLDAVHKSRPGRIAQAAAERTPAGRRLKSYIMKNVWNRY